MKLSKAQLKAIDKAKKSIAEARMFDKYEDWLRHHIPYYSKFTDREIREETRQGMDYTEYWEKGKQGIVLTSAGKNTIEALVKMGIFEVVEYNNYRHNGVIDWVKYNENWEA